MTDLHDDNWHLLCCLHVQIGGGARILADGSCRYDVILCRTWYVGMMRVILWPAIKGYRACSSCVRLFLTWGTQYSGFVVLGLMCSTIQLTPCRFSCMYKLDSRLGWWLMWVWWDAYSDPHLSQRRQSSSVICWSRLQVIFPAHLLSAFIGLHIYVCMYEICGYDEIHTLSHIYLIPFGIYTNV